MRATDLTRISLRLTQEEANRLAKVVEIADRESKGCASLNHVLKELLGFVPYRLLNESHRRMLMELRIKEAAS